MLIIEKDGTHQFNNNDDKLIGPIEKLKFDKAYITSTLIQYINKREGMG